MGFWGLSDNTIKYGWDFFVDNMPLWRCLVESSALSFGYIVRSEMLRFVINVCKAYGIYRKEPDLPEGALLDYKKEIDNIRKEVMCRVQDRITANEHCIEKNDDLAKRMQETLQIQRDIFNSIGISLGEQNPIVKHLSGQLQGIDDFADKARRTEIARCEMLGLKPEIGWELARLEQLQSNPKRNKGYLSEILLNRAIGPVGASSRSDINNNKDDDKVQMQATSKKRRAMKRLRI